MIVRDAVEADLPAIVALLADDALGAARENAADLAPYRTAFTEIVADGGSRLLVGEDGGEVVATLQVTVTPGLSSRGARRATIEAVRVAASRRGQGLGRVLIRAAVDHARARGCRMVQLTTNKARADAQRFYAGLGFAASHVGMKLHLGEDAPAPDGTDAP